MMSHLKDDRRQLFRNLFYPERTRNLDVDKWVAYCAEAGATSVCLDVKTQAYALYDSDFIPKDPVIGDRDLAAELAAAAEKHELKWCAYIPPYQQETLRNSRREWQMRLEDGSIYAEQGTGFLKTSFCWNSPYLDLLCSILREIAERYHPHGFYIDGMRFAATVDQLTCHCDFCRKRFQTEYNRPLPSSQDDSADNRESLIRFLQARKKWLGDAARKMREAVDSIDPKVTLFVNNKFGSGGWAESNGPDPFAPYDFICREVIPHVVRNSLAGAPYGFTAADWFMWECAAQRAAKQGKPCQLYVSLSPISRTEDINLTLDLACAVGSPLAIQERRSDTEPFLARIAETEPFTSGLEPAPDVVVHYGEATRLARYPLTTEGSKDFMNETANVYKALLNLHRPVDLVLDQDLENGDFRKAKLAVLPNSAALNETAKKQLLNFVKEGGSAITTMTTGTLDEFGGRVTDELIFKGSGLRELGPIKTRMPFGVEMKGEELVFEDPVTANPAQFLVFKEGAASDWLGEEIAVDNHPEPIEERELFQLRDEPSMALPVDAVRVEAGDDWSILATIRHRDDATGEWEESPAIATKQIGKGRLTYLAFQLGALFTEKSLWSDVGHAWPRNLIKHLVELAIGPPAIIIEAPSCVKTMAWRRDGATLVHLVNELSALHPAIRMEERLPVAIRIRVPESTFRSVTVALAGDNKCETRQVDGEWRVTCPALKDRVLLVCESSAT